MPEHEAGGFEKVLAKVGRVIDRRLVVLTFAGSACFLALVDLNASNAVKVSLLVGGLILAVVGDWLRNRDQPAGEQLMNLDLADEVRELKEEKQALEDTIVGLRKRLEPETTYRVLFDLFLRILAENVLKQPEGQRMTVFRVKDEHDGDSGRHQTWLLQYGRYSKNPYLAQQGRTRISADDPGCLRAALEKGYHYACGIPDPEDNPRGFKEAVARECAGMDGALALNLRMKSRSILAVAIDDLDTGRRGAVVVIESEEKDGVPPVTAATRETLVDGVDKMIAMFLRNESGLEPDPSLAMRMGF